MWGVTNQVSALKISTAWTTDLKKKSDTRSTASSLLRMRDRYLYSYVLSTPRGLFYFPLSLSSSVATAPYCSTARPITTCSRHRIPNQSPAALSDP